MSLAVVAPWLEGAWVDAPQIIPEPDATPILITSLPGVPNVDPDVVITYCVNPFHFIVTGEHILLGPHIWRTVTTSAGSLLVMDIDAWNARHLAWKLEEAAQLVELAVLERIEQEQAEQADNVEGETEVDQ